MPKEIEGVTYYTADEIYRSQEDVDRVIQERLERDRQNRPGKPADYDQIKQERAELAAKVEGFDTALDQARQEAAEQAKREASEALIPNLVTAEIRALAAKNFRDPDDAISQYGDTSGLWNDGAVDADTIKSRLSDIAKAKPYLLATEDLPPSPGDAGIGVGGGDPAPNVQPGVSRLAAAYSQND